ncbi:MAG: phosphomannomutase/phosphoglucomutase [Alphaproteobacteria bacterium]|nr:phosphomannomutase/phosphoglucomutase [Alphaproteobacteria bacterium]
MIHPHIFREYDIRGVTTDNFTAEVVRAIAQAFADRAPGTVVIARDGRLSSPALAKALAEGLQAGGCNVVDIGLAPTPMLYYAATTMKAAGGVMLTGSHNPPDHNGMKFMLGGKAFYGADILSLRDRCQAAGDRLQVKKGAYSTLNLHAEYLAALLAAYDGTRELKVAWDAGNGATGEVMAALCESLPGTHLTLNEKIDGTFPAHHPDPTVPKNLAQLIDKVREEKCDLGIAFDGDGDRIGVVDNEGEILWGDQLLMLYAADILQRLPGATIIADVKASGALFEEVARLGGTPLMWKTGHSLIKSKMAETGAPLAGEMSGHIFFADKYYGFDDALYAAVRLLGVASRSGKKLSDLRKALPSKVNTPEIRFECDDARKFAVIEEVKTRLRAAHADFSDVDGVRVNTPDGWWLLRASNTQPMLVARCESRDQAGLTSLKQDLQKQLALSNVALP